MRSKSACRKIFTMHWQISANCLRQRSARMTSSFSNTTSKRRTHSTEQPKPGYSRKQSRRDARQTSRGREDGKPWRGVVVEIHVPGHINFKWNHSNLENSIMLGYAAAKQAIDAFNKAENEIKANSKDGKLLKPIFINENPQDDANWLICEIVLMRV